MYHTPESAHIPGYDTWKVNAKRKEKWFCFATVLLENLRLSYFQNIIPRKVSTFREQYTEIEHFWFFIPQKVSQNFVKIHKYLCKIWAKIGNNLLGDYWT